MNVCMCAGSACTLTPDDHRHGSTNGYTNCACRCEPCRAAHAVECRSRQAERVARGVPAHLHGTSGGYGNWGCRCDLCRKAWSADDRERRRRRRRGQTDVALGVAPTPRRRP
jgi:hypothetical protein